MLASYLVNKEEGESLEDYLNNKVFAGQEGEEVQPDERDVRGFDEFMVRYKEGLAIERAAVEHLK